jgi:hypothetical protein
MDGVKMLSSDLLQVFVASHQVARNERLKAWEIQVIFYCMPNLVTEVVNTQHIVLL